jgi:hypothetical protein
MSTIFNLPDLKITPKKNTEIGFLKVYVKNKHFKYLDSEGFEKDIVLERPLDGFALQTTVSQITSSDTIISALGKLQAGISLFSVSVLFQTVTPFTYIAPEPMTILSVSNPNALTFSITINGSAYTLGTTIAQYDTIVVTVNSTGFIKLNCTL